MMVTCGWLILFLLLIIGLCLGGVSLGLLSGLGLGFLTYLVQPAAPPNDLILLQSTWFLLMATLESIGFFDLLESKLINFIKQVNNHYGFLVALFCYSLVFLTGDNEWVYRCICGNNALLRDKNRLLVLVGIAAHMALLVSPLSISGILLIVVVGNSGLAILDLIGVIVSITVGMIAVSSLLFGLIPDQWVPCEWFNKYTKYDVDIVTISKDKGQLTFLLLFLVVVLFLLVKPEANQFTELSLKIFPVRFPMFFALIMLSIAAVIMLGFRLNLSNILQSYRFKLGIQQFFIFLGLAWLLDSLIRYDRVFLIKMLCDSKFAYEDFLLATLYMLLIDIPIIIWLFSGLLLEQHYSIVTFAILLVLVHSLAPVRWWLSRVVQQYKQSSGV